MRVIQFIDSLNIGGAERMAVNISNILVREGHDVMLIVSRDNGSLFHRISESVETKFLRKKSFFDIIAFVRLIFILVKFRPQILHAHSSSVFWAVFSTYFIKLKFKVIYHDHYGMSEKLEQRSSKFLKILASRIDKIIAVNENLVKWNKSNLEVSENNITCIKNFPFLKQINKKDKSDVIVVLCLANFREQKDHVTLIKAFFILVNQFKIKNVKLFLAGDLYYDRYQSEIEKTIMTLNLKDYVEVYGPITDVESLLSMSDIGVLSSISEGLPVSLLEYGLAALPVVVTNVGQCGEVLGYGQYGSLVNPGDSYGLASQIQKYIRDRENAYSIGENFKMHILNNYGPLSFIESYINFISK